jgi:hypothetical protein
MTNGCDLAFVGGIVALADNIVVDGMPNET